MPVNPRLIDPDTNRLFEAVLALDSVEECYRFFEDLCTIQEIKSMAARLKTASMLYQGRTYEEIEKASGMSTATISRVRRALYYGADGYRLVLDRLLKDQSQAPGQGS